MNEKQKAAIPSDAIIISDRDGLVTYAVNNTSDGVNFHYVRTIGPRGEQKQLEYHYGHYGDN